MTESFAYTLGFPSACSRHPDDRVLPEENTRPDLLILDELGYIPLDKHGADLLFQVISQRYERGSIILTSDKAYKDWPEVFNNDSTVTSAILDRLLHHCQTHTITGNSYRMGKKIQE